MKKIMRQRSRKGNSSAGPSISRGGVKSKKRRNQGKMAGVAGLEPVTSAVTGQRSNQLSYTPAPREQKGKKTFRSRQRASRGTGNDSGSRRQGGGGGEPR